MAFDSKSVATIPFCGNHTTGITYSGGGIYIPTVYDYVMSKFDKTSTHLGLHRIQEYSMPLTNT